MSNVTTLSTKINKQLNILSQTPNASRNEAEFDRSEFSRKAKMINTSQQQ